MALVDDSLRVRKDVFDRVPLVFDCIANSRMIETAKRLGKRQVTK